MHAWHRCVPIASPIQRDDAPSAVTAEGASAVHDGITERLEELARRAGLKGVSAPVLGAGIVVLGAVVAFGVWRWWPQDVGMASGGPAAAPAVLSGAAAPTTGAAGAMTSEASSTASDTPGIDVHVVGAVRRPGLYELKGGSRVADAVQAAGGFLGNAAEEGVNLARKLTDGEQLVVPTAEQFAKSGGVAVTAGASTGSGAAAGAASGAPVDINSATAEQLDVLPGVGPATAMKIVADRQANGPFKSVDDLGRVAGIGPKKLEDLKALIVAR
jgi:competence protein ComEA